MDGYKLNILQHFDVGNFEIIVFYDCGVMIL